MLRWSVKPLICINKSNSDVSTSVAKVPKSQNTGENQAVIAFLFRSSLPKCWNKTVAVGCIFNNVKSKNLSRTESSWNADVQTNNSLHFMCLCLQTFERTFRKTNFTSRQTFESCRETLLIEWPSYWHRVLPVFSCLYVLITADVDRRCCCF